MLALRFARRYLFSKKSHSVINLISGVSVVAVSLPVAAMIILLSVFNGFEGLIRSMASAFDADLTITPTQGLLFEREELDAEALAAHEGVAALSFVVEQKGLIRHDDKQQQVTLRGVEEGYCELFPIEEALTQGAYRLDEERNLLLMGRSMNYLLGMYGADRGPVSLYALRSAGLSSFLPMAGYTRREAEVAGLFSLDARSEEEYVLCNRRLVEELFGVGDKVSALLLRVEGDSERLRDELQAVVGEEFRVRTRYELRPTFYDIMTYEKWGIFFIALLILVLASFSMVGSLVMLILEKRDEAETLRSMGADTSFIRRIFLCEGGLIALFGAILGTLPGVAVTLAQQHLGLIKMPVESFIVDSYPVEFRWGDLAATLVAFALITGLVSLLTVHSMIRTKPKTEKN